MQLGQLPAQGNGALRAKGGAQVVQCSAQLVGGLIKNHGAGLPLQKFQPLAALLFGHRQKALKHKPGGILPRNRQRRHAGTGTRHRRYRNAAGNGVFHDLLTGVADAGHTGVRAERAALPRFNAVQNCRAMVQRMLIIAHHRLF